jgi:pimeloyl-ACP methyl ester carboxylesterase
LLGSADGGFRSADARQHYLTTYGEARALTARADVVHDVPTGFGTIRVYQHGPDRGVPIVLIHGFFLTSGMWWQQLDDLTGDFTVYALDMVGQPGVSMQSKPMSSTVARLSGRFWRSLALLLTRPNSARAKRAAAWVTGHPAPGSSIDMLTELFVAGFAAFAPPLRTPPLHFSGNRLLRSVHLPVQVLLAGNSVHDSSKAIRRI